MAQTDTWQEDFLAPALDPSWTVLSNLSPNHYSLTDNPGHLRYYLAPAMHWDSWPNYAYVWDEGTHYWYAPSLVLLRNFTGGNWILKTKVTYDFSVVRNGRQQSFYIVWKHDGTRKLTFLQITRDNDVDWWNRNSVGVSLWEEGELLGSWGKKLPMSLDTHYFEVTREGKAFTVRYSEDDQNWDTLFSATMISNPGDLQTLSIEGSSWKYTSPGDYAEFDYFYVEPTILPIAIDIKPGNVPVAILSSATFDAVTVDRSTVEFAGAHPLPNYCSQLGEIPEDVDGDGLLDIVFNFKIQDLNLPPGDTEACLTGETFSGQEFRGCDSVCRLGPVVGDLNNDCKMDFKDFAIFASHWLECADPNCD
jgi:hypothetical protein